MEGLPERFGKYHVLERIARGGMAEIYKVKTVGIAGFEKIQALKRILPDFAQRPRFIRSFIDEARIAVELNHRNIVQVFDFGKASGELYLAMELIDGVNLRTVIRDAARSDIALPIALSSYVLNEVAAGLDYAHRKCDAHGRALHIVHCDVSPQNIMLSREGFVKILDFGVARARFGTAPKGRRLRGKPRYMAPEQTRGEPPSAPTDVFALAIIVWELLTGLPLFEGRDLADILAAVRRADVPAADKLNPSVPPELSAAVARALTPQPDQRGTAAELGNALHQAVRELGAGTGSRAMAEWLSRVYPPPVGEDTAQTSIEVPRAPPRSETPAPDPTLNTMTATLSGQLLEEIDEVVSEGPTTLMDRRHVVAVVIIATGSAPATRREIIRMLADLAYKRGAVVHDQEDDSAVAVFGLEIAGEDNLARAMGYALDAVEVSRETAVVTAGALGLHIAARAGIVAKCSIDGYHLVGDAVVETRALAREAKPGRPLLSGGAGRLTSAHFAFRELPARRLRRQRLRVLELLGPRSFDERDRVFRERRGRFIGRQAELDRLAAALARAGADKQRVVVTITGRAGVGKSRLVAEFVARLEPTSPAPSLVAVAAMPAGQEAPFSMVTELFQTALNLPPGRGATARGRFAQRLRHVMTRAGLDSEDIDEVVGATELGMELRDGAVVSSQSASADLRERIAVALRIFRNALVRDDRPLITIIEDLHFADATSAEVVRTTLEPPAEPGAELLIITSRPQSDAASAVASILANDDTEKLTLVELRGDERSKLIRDRLADAASDEAIGAVASRAGGNPFLIEELAAAVREIGPGEVPASAREVIVARVDRLPAATKATIQHAAVIGRTFRARIVEELLGTDLNAELRDLLADGLLQRADHAGQEASEGELAFAHGLLQEVVYQSLSAAARRETHAKLGKLLAWRYQAGREEPPATIAHHLALGGDALAAAAYTLRAGRVALAAFDAAAAVKAFTRTLELDAKGAGAPVTVAAQARRREALAGRERAYGQLGDHEAQAADLELLRELAKGSPRHIAELDNRAAERFIRLGDYGAAVACSEDAEHHAEEGGDERTRGEALRLRGEAYERQGEYERALDVVRRALSIFKLIGAVAEETRAMIGAGRILLMRAQYEAAKDAYQPILERVNDNGDPWLERIVHNHISVIQLCLGDFEPAMAAAQRSLEICRRLGDRAREGDNVSVCGIILLDVGRYAEARGYFDQALDMLDRTGSRWSRADCLVYAGTAESHLGDPSLGVTRIEEAVALASEIGAKYIEANALVALATALLRIGDSEDEVDRALEAATRATLIAREASLAGPEIQGLSRQAEAIWRAGYLDAALALSTRAIRLLHKQRYVEGSEEEIVFTHYRLLDAVDSPEAKNLLERAWQGYQLKLGRLEDPVWRDSFANHVPLHVAIRAAYGDL